MTIYDTCKEWELYLGCGGEYEKSFEYAHRKLKLALRMFIKIWYIECIISIKRANKHITHS